MIAEKQAGLQTRVHGNADVAAVLHLSGFWSVAGTHHMTHWRTQQGKWKTVFLSSHSTLFSAFHPSKVSVMPTRPSPSSAAASSISYLKYRTRNDYLCPEISRSDSGVNSFGKQMLIHHILLARIQKWLPWHRLNCEWQTKFQDFDKLVHHSALFPVACVCIPCARGMTGRCTFTSSPGLFMEDIREESGGVKATDAAWFSCFFFIPLKFIDDDSKGAFETRVTLEVKYRHQQTST